MRFCTFFGVRCTWVGAVAESIYCGVLLVVGSAVAGHEEEYGGRMFCLFCVLAASFGPLRDFDLGVCFSTAISRQLLFGCREILTDSAAAFRPSRDSNLGGCFSTAFQRLLPWAMTS